MPAGACLFYSLLFLPISPFAVIGIIYFGIGFLPLSPILALWAVLLLRKNLLQKIDFKPFPLSWLGLGTGFLIAVSIIGLSELRFMVTRFGLETAVSEDVEKQEQGIDFLRKYGNEDYILQLVGSRRNRVYISDLIINLFNSSQSTSDKKLKKFIIV